MIVVRFDYKAKFGHFLRAEATANGITYPVPPRTVLLGLVGAVLGLGKDETQVELADARLAVGGPLPRRFWHKTNVRKDPPALLPSRITAKAKGSSPAGEKNFRFPQEWLWRPSYAVWAALPEPRQTELALRLREQRWHFTPCMGLSEMLAEVVFVEQVEAEQLPGGTYQVHAVARQSGGRVDTEAACREPDPLTIQTLRMPRAVTADRVFTHDNYWVEHRGRPFPLATDQAWRCGQEVVTFL